MLWLENGAPQGLKRVLEEARQGTPPRSPGDPREEADEAGGKALPVAAARPHFRPLFLSKMKETWIPIGPLFSFWVPLGPKCTYFLTILKHNADADTIPQQK